MFVADFDLYGQAVISVIMVFAKLLLHTLILGIVYRALHLPSFVGVDVIVGCC